MNFHKAVVKLKDNMNMDINEGNLWSIVVYKTNVDGEDKYGVDVVGMNV